MVIIMDDKRRHKDPSPKRIQVLNSKIGVLEPKKMNKLEIMQIPKKMMAIA